MKYGIKTNEPESKKSCLCMPRFLILTILIIAVVAVVVVVAVVTKSSNNDNSLDERRQHLKNGLKVQNANDSWSLGEDVGTSGVFSRQGNYTFEVSPNEVLRVYDSDSM